MRNSTATIVAATVVFVTTVAAIVLLLIFGSEQIQGTIEQAFVAVGGTVGTAFLGWLAMRLRKDENNNGIPDDLEGGSGNDGK